MSKIIKFKYSSDGEYTTIDMFNEKNEKVSIGLNWIERGNYWEFKDFVLVEMIDEFLKNNVVERVNNE